MDIGKEVIELVKLWGKAAIVIGFEDSNILTSVLPLDYDESPPTPKSLHEISAEIFTLADRGGVPICLIAWKEYEPLQIMFMTKPCLDFTEHPWAKRAYEFYLEDHVYSLTEDGIEVEQLKTGKVH